MAFINEEKKSSASRITFTNEELLRITSRDKTMKEVRIKIATRKAIKEENSPRKRIFSTLIHVLKR